jgi:hypothetical protein
MVIGEAPSTSAPDQLAVIAQHLLFAVIYGYTLDETTELGAEIAGPPEAEAANAVRAYLARLPAGRFPNLNAVAEHFNYADRDQSFELLVDIFVDGLAARSSTHR